MRKPIQTAAARHAGGIVIPVELTPGEIVEFRFAASLGIAMLSVLDRLQSIEGTSAARAIQQAQAVTDYLTATVHETQRERFQQAINDNTLDMLALGEIFAAIREESEGMDPTRQESSADGSSETGTGLTDGVPQEA
jgi:hypothetical protein